ncbi:MAG: PD-(D/E)XK nuclease family protein, partial [bacterium]|nr:PD-(D/E)XK nuclease family protein [bacterium]
MGFYKWIGTGFDANELIALCRAGLIAFPEGDAPEPYEVAQILTRAHVTQGRDQYTHALNRIETDLQDTEHPEEQRRQEQIQADFERLAAVRRILDRLFSFLPKAPESDFKTLTQAGLQFLQHNAPIRSPIDTSALDSLMERLTLLGETIHVSDTLQRLATRLTELFANHRVETAAAQPGHLAIAPLERAGYTHRKHIYLVGLDEGSFPGGASEDPLLLDGERTALSAELSLHRTRPAEQVWHLIRLLGMAPGPVTLLSARRSLADGRESYPSAFFQQMAEQMNLGDLPLLPPLPEAPEDALDLTETMLISHPSEGSAQAIQDRFPWLQSGATARRAREHPGLTRFDGFLGRPTPELDLTKGQPVLSASRLETLAGCPYRYFLAYILRITPPDKIEDDPTHWLSPLDFGALLHRLFRRFMETLQERGERPDRDRHADLLDQLLRQEIEIHKEEIPVQHQAAYRFDVKRLETAAKVFLSVEADKTDVEPVGFELSFGFG